MVGVFSREWVEPLAHVFNELKNEKVWVVHGSDGLDEITTTGVTYVAALDKGKVSTFEISPEDVGLQKAAPADLKGGEASDNARAIMDVLNGKPGAFRDIVILNTAAALVVAGKAENLQRGAALATDSLDSGKALKALEKLIELTNQEAS